MKILYTPLMIVPSLSAEQRAGILEAAGPGTVLVEAKEPARQRAEIVDTDILFGRVAPDIFVLNRRLRFAEKVRYRWRKRKWVVRWVVLLLDVCWEEGAAGREAAKSGKRAPPQRTTVGKKQAA